MTPIVTTSARPRPVTGRWVRTIDRTGPFPTVADPRWTPGQLARWRAVRDVAAAHVATTAGGWSEQTLGWRPGARPMLACWVAAPVAGVGVVQATAAGGLPQALAAYAGVAAGAWLIARGVRCLHRAGVFEYECTQRAAAAIGAAGIDAASAATVGIGAAPAQPPGRLPTARPLRSISWTRSEEATLLAAAVQPPPGGDGP